MNKLVLNKSDESEDHQDISYLKLNKEKHLSASNDFSEF